MASQEVIGQENPDFCLLVWEAESGGGLYCIHSGATGISQVSVASEKLQLTVFFSPLVSYRLSKVMILS